MNVKPLALGLVLATALAASCQADTGLKPLVGTHITFGGETLVKVQYTDGHTQSIHSGGLFQIFGGAEYESDSFVVQGTVGYHVDDTSAKNGSVRFDRFPVELIGLWKTTDKVRLGLGVRSAGGAKVSSSGAAADVGHQSFKSSTGLIVQGEYFFGPNWSGVARVVKEDYTANGVKVSGNHVGLGVAYRF
jgi:hypothetical protein